MNWKHFLLFLLWSATVAIVVGVLMLVFTFGDCLDPGACRGAKNSAPRTIMGTGFVIYWAVAFLMFRRWSR